MISFDKQIIDLVELKRSKGLYRQRTVFHPADINFSSNDYLNLSNHPKLLNAYQEGFRKYPSSSTGSMVLNGYKGIHQTFEASFARYLGVEDALLFSSGYMANLAITALLSHLKAMCVIDKSIHASLYDGLKLHDLTFKRFPHQDIEKLEELLDNQDPSSVVLTEGVFSMSGLVTPLSLIAQACQKKKAALIVDEAHAFGVYGPQGRGVSSLMSVSEDILPLRVYPLGKAFAAQGAVIAGKKSWIDALIQVSRSYIYSTGVSPALCYGFIEAIDLIAHADERRKQLFENIKLFKSCLTSEIRHLCPSDSPIQLIKLGSAQKALFISQILHKNGLICLPIRRPTVSEKDSGLRIILNHDHSEENIKKLCQLLNEHCHVD